MLEDSDDRYEGRNADAYGQNFQCPSIRPNREESRQAKLLFPWTRSCVRCIRGSRELALAAIVVSRLYADIRG